MADHLSVLWTGLLVWLQSGGGHRGVHTRNTNAGILLTTVTDCESVRCLCVYYNHY